MVRSISASVRFQGVVVVVVGLVAVAAEEASGGDVDGAAGDVGGGVVVEAVIEVGVEALAHLP